MASDFQRPRSWMESVSTLAHSRAMAPPAQRERASNFGGLDPEGVWSDVVQAFSVCVAVRNSKS
jgi:hypothetical protein